MRALFATLVVALCGCHSAPPKAPWRELFDGTSLGAFASSEFGGDGEVVVRDGALQLGIGSPLTGVTWRGPLPQGDYELEVEATRVQGNDFFCGLTFPVGGAHLTLVLGGWGGALCGLSSLDGRDAAHNETRCFRAFTAGRRYLVRIQVTAAEVSAWIDGTLLCRTTWPDHELSLRPEVTLSAPLGIASFNTAAAIHAVRWRPRPGP